MTLGDGLEEIGMEAFDGCRSLHDIVIPNAVRVIKRWAFFRCSGLTSVTLGNGLEEIGAGAFHGCTSLEEIDIPTTVKEIDDTTFRGCTNLMRVRFCNEIEQFVCTVAPCKHYCK